MDYSKLIHLIIDSFVENSESILIRTIDNEKPNDVTILICSENNDTAKLIGKKGCVANAIREIVAITGKLENKRVHVKFESFDDEGK